MDDQLRPNESGEGMKLKRKHLADGTYFVWRCEHNHGKEDRASDRNDGPQLGECDVELVAAPDYGHRYKVASAELARVMSEFHSVSERVADALEAIRRDLARGADCK